MIVIMNEKEGVKMIREKDLISLDIETDFSRKMFNLSFITDKQDYDFWFFQNVETLNYPENCDKVYLIPRDRLIKKIGDNQTSKIKIALQILKDLTDTGLIVIGYNIQKFDIPIIRKYMKKYEIDSDWNPLYFDLYLEVKNYIKKGSKYHNKITRLTDSGNKSLSCQSVFEVMTGMNEGSYNELHTGISDCKDEKHLLFTLRNKFKGFLKPEKVKRFNDRFEKVS